MTNPTRQEIIDAHDALTELRALAESNPPRHDTHAEKLESRIFAALPAPPQPTMAEVEWDDELHYLAEADHADWGTVIMLYYDETMRGIQYLCTGEANRACFSIPDAFTPTGRRYTLTEVEE